MVESQSLSAYGRVMDLARSFERDLFMGPLAFDTYGELKKLAEKVKEVQDDLATRENLDAAGMSQAMEQNQELQDALENTFARFLKTVEQYALVPDPELEDSAREYVKMVGEVVRLMEEILDGLGLGSVYQRLINKYGNGGVNYLHFHQSLTYFYEKTKEDGVDPNGPRPPMDTADYAERASLRDQVEQQILTPEGRSPVTRTLVGLAAQSPDATEAGVDAGVDRAISNAPQEPIRHNTDPGLGNGLLKDAASLPPVSVPSPSGQQADQKVTSVPGFYTSPYGVGEAGGVSMDDQDYRSRLDDLASGVIPISKPAGQWATTPEEPTAGKTSQFRPNYADIFTPPPPSNPSSLQSALARAADEVANQEANQTTEDQTQSEPAIEAYTPDPNLPQTVIPGLTAVQSAQATNIETDQTAPEPVVESKVEATPAPAQDLSFDDTTVTDAPVLPELEPAPISPPKPEKPISIISPAPAVVISNDFDEPTREIPKVVTPLPAQSLPSEPPKRPSDRPSFRDVLAGTRSSVPPAALEKPEALNVAEKASPEAPKPVQQSERSIPTQPSLKVQQERLKAEQTTTTLPGKKGSRFWKWAAGLAAAGLAGVVGYFYSTSSDDHDTTDHHAAATSSASHTARTPGSISSHTQPVARASSGPHIASASSKAPAAAPTISVTRSAPTPVASARPTAPAQVPTSAPLAASEGPTSTPSQGVYRMDTSHPAFTDYLCYMKTASGLVDKIKGSAQNTKVFYSSDPSARTNAESKYTQVLTGSETEQEQRIAMAKAVITSAINSSANNAWLTKYFNDQMKELELYQQTGRWTHKAKAIGADRLFNAVQKPEKLTTAPNIIGYAPDVNPSTNPAVLGVKSATPTLYTVLQTVGNAMKMSTDPNDLAPYDDFRSIKEITCQKIRQAGLKSKDADTRSGIGYMHKHWCADECAPQNPLDKALRVTIPIMAEKPVEKNSVPNAPVTPANPNTSESTPTSIPAYDLPPAHSKLNAPSESRSRQKTPAVEPAKKPSLWARATAKVKSFFGFGVAEDSKAAAVAAKVKAQRTVVASTPTKQVYTKKDLPMLSWTDTLKEYFWG